MRTLRFAPLVSVSLFLAAFAASARAATVPAPEEAGKIPDVSVSDEANRPASLWEKLRAAGDGPVFVLPVYTRCTLSCPLLARRLNQETARMGAGAAYRVLIFSFDPSDDAESLRRFREREQLPSNWILVHASEQDTRRLCDFFHYPVWTEGSVLVHPNQVFLLDHNLDWRATFTGLDWNAAELVKWMNDAESSGISAWLAMNPEKLVWIGFGLLLLSLVVMLAWLVRRKPSRHSATASL